MLDLKRELEELQIMISLKKIENGYRLKFELDYIYPTHKELINELFEDYILQEEDKITIDISNVKIIDISSFKNLLSQLTKLRKKGKDITIIFPSEDDDYYVSRMFELTKFNIK